MHRPSNKTRRSRQLLLSMVALLGACQPVGDASDKQVSVVSGTGSTASGPDYAAIYDRSRIASYSLSLSSGAWQALQDDPTTYVPATFRSGEDVYEQVGVRFKGNVSLEFAGPKKSIRVKFDQYIDGQRFHGLSRINLHNGFKDPTLMRELHAYDLHAAAGNVASRTSHARVTISVPGLHDADHFGLYINTEPVNRAYLRNRFDDDSGTLYKGGDFRWWGEADDEYVPWPYEPRTNEESTDHTALIRFLDVLNNTPALELGPAIAEVFDVDRFVGWLAANTLLSNMDGIPGWGGNCYLYHDVTRDKLVLIPWDMNEAFGSTSEGLDLDELLTLDIYAPVVYPGASPIIERMLEAPSFVAAYEARLTELVAGPFSAATMEAAFDATAAQIRGAVYADDKRHYSDEEFEQSIEQDVPGRPDPPYPPDNRVIGLKRFVRERVASVAAQLP